MAVVILIELAVDPSMTKPRIDRIGLGRTPLPRRFLRQLQPDAGGIGGLLRQPLLERLAIAKSQDR